MPDYLFWPEGGYNVPVQLSLERESLRHALSRERTVHDFYSEVCGRKVYVPREMLAAQLARVLEQLQVSEDFEVALMPKKAFDKIGMEMVSWRDSAVLCWLGDTMQSVYTPDETMRGSIHGFAEYTFGRMMASWKSKRQVVPLLRKWLREGLAEVEGDSAYIRNWDILPKE